MSVAPGSHLGPYELLAPLGAGAMGEVWRARDTRLGREVAVKILPPAFAASAERLQRFEQEARAAGSLNHPNLVTVHDLGTHDGAPYIVMELLDGETLRDRIEGNGTPGIPQRKAIDYSIQLACGLAAAHEHGVVHRDLKPENVFVTRDGRVKILDFGLAKLRGQSDSLGHITTAVTEARATAPGTVMGTAGYMSPEQVRGQDVDHRTDIFAFGAILYEMLSGRRAFHGPSSVETMNAILKDDPPDLASDGPRVAPAIDRVVRRCLEKNREERFHSAHDVAFALEAVTTGSSTASGPRVAAPARRAWRVAAIVAACATAAAVGWLAARTLTRPVPPLERHLTQLTFDAGVESQPTISPDGKSVVYVAGAGSNRDIFVQRVGGANAINLTKDSPVHDDEPAFSPDGQQIAFRSERDGGGIFLMGATGESVRRLCDFGYNPAWSPDGKSIGIDTEKIADPSARVLISHIWTVNVESGARKVLFDRSDAVQPAWSPHDHSIAFWGVLKGRRVIFTMSARGGKATPIIDDGSMNWNPFWSPDGKVLYFCSDRAGMMNLWRAPIDERTGLLQRKAEPVTLSTEWSGPASIARDGRSIAFAVQRGEWHLYEIPFDPVKVAFTGSATELVRGSRRIQRGELSPDGKYIAFNNLGAQEDIYIARRDGTDLRQLTNDTFKDRMPRWSPDGSRLIFYSTRGGDYDVWTIRADGSGLQQLTHGFNLIEATWSPDGKHVVAYDNARRLGVIFEPFAGRTPEQLPRPSQTEGFWPTAFSPDAKRIAGIITDRFGQWSAVAVYDLATRTYRRLTDWGTGPVWLDDHVLLMPRDVSVIAYDLRSGQTRTVGLLPNGLPFLRRISLTGDRSSILFVSGPTESDIWLVTLSR
ncbi:MAG: protein kinase [Acidobacteriota bacterium]